MLDFRRVKNVGSCKSGSLLCPFPSSTYCLIALFTTTTTTTTTDPTSHHPPHASPPLRIRFISTWLPARLPPSQSHDIKASRSLLNPLRSHSLFLFPNTPSIRTLALPEDADTAHPNPAPVPQKAPNPDLKFAPPKSSPYGTLGVQSCPLRCAGIHPGPSAHPPCSPHKPRFGCSAKFLHDPFPCALAFTDHSYRWMHLPS